MPVSEMLLLLLLLLDGWNREALQCSTVRLHGPASSRSQGHSRVTRRCLVSGQRRCCAETVLPEVMQ